jgi:hypothetical protein
MEPKKINCYINTLGEQITEFIYEHYMVRHNKTLGVCVGWMF